MPNKSSIELLPKELRKLVRIASLMLGQTIKTYEGDAFYNLVESYRRRLKKFRISKNQKLLNQLYSNIKKHNETDLMKITHAFSMLLELINVCEAAYRTWRQRYKTLHTDSSSKIELNYVLTAHPTEARSNDVVTLLGTLTELFVEGMHNGFTFNESRIYTQLGLLWHYPLVKTQKTTVHNEAEYIYSIIFSHPLFDFILEDKSNYSLRLSTWVGGDKDGHPGVTDKTMLDSLSLSRSYFIAEIQRNLDGTIPDILILKKGNKDNLIIINRIKSLLHSIERLSQVKTNDGKRITIWKRSYAAFLKSAPLFIRRHHLMRNVSRMIAAYPALVLPIELRDNSVEITQAVTNKKLAIRKMLSTLKQISRGMDITAYVHGLIISHCCSTDDLTNAAKLVYLAAGTKKLPVLPLFEDKTALDSAATILSEWLLKPANQQLVKKFWHGKFEIMLGYSDSAKQIGVLPSRFMIRESMFKIEKLLKRYKLTPVFFHGSGGSVERGGGSMQEQIAWWPDSAIKAPKLTIQGEMVQRRFSTAEILNSECLHLSNEAKIRRAHKANIVKSATLEKFVGVVEDAYVSLISDNELLGYCLQATPYKYLSVLKLGSRPSSRTKSSVSVESLRAIPWILSWTQTRLLFPSWWGIGTAWISLSKSEQSKLKKLYKTDPFFSSFVKTLGFTLAKVEMPIWREYLEQIHGRESLRVFKFFETEYNASLRFMHEVSQTKRLLSHRPWLEESIRLRSPYVHLLNLMQILAITTHNEKLLKETLAGIACGMLTTG